MLKLRKPSRAFFDPDEVLSDSSGDFNASPYYERRLEKPLTPFYSGIFFILIVAVLIYLFSRAFFLGVEKGDTLFAKSQGNRFSVRDVFPPRGVIYDRYDEPLVENVPSFGIFFEKDEFMKNQAAATDDMSKKVALSSMLKTLGDILQKPQEYFEGMGFTANEDPENLPARVFITQDLPLETVFSLSSGMKDLPGIQIFETYRRSYKKSYAYSHLLGFVGKVSPEDLSKNPRLRHEESVGKSGLEAFYDNYLRGEKGKKIIEVDSFGRETNFRLTEDPQEGDLLRLSVDGKLQDTIYGLLESYTGGGKGASVVALDPQNGEILALVSFPGFDANEFGNSLTQKEFNAILKNPLSPLFNRAIGGEFPSGSTLKPLIGAAALEEKIIDPLKKIYDEGFIEIPNPYRPGEKSVFLDWKKHGWVDFYDAIAQSANVYFYTVGGGYQNQKGLGIERIKKYASLFGLGSLLGIDLPGEKAGFIPDADSKKVTEPEDPVWRVGDTYNVSIGQGGVKVTTLQMASLTSTIANGGKIYRPRLLREAVNNQGEILFKFAPEVLREGMVSQENLTEVVKGMRRAVTNGTAGRLNDLPISVAAKTGTAQIGKNQLPHAWVTALAPVENPRIALAVMVEHAGEGSTVAVPITHEILKWYFENR